MQRHRSECCCSHCFVTQKHHEGTNNRDGRTWDSFHRFVNKGRRASAIGEAKYKLVFGAAEDLDAKFQNILKNKDSPLHNCVTLNVTPSRLGSAKNFSVDIWGILLTKISQANSKGASAYPT